MSSNQLAGTASMLMALIYVCAFVYFGAMVSFPASNEADVVMAFVTQNVNALWIAYFTIYVIFGVLLAVVVIAIDDILSSCVNQTQNRLLRMGTLFGKIWVCLVIASGMIATIGMSHAVSTTAVSNEEAYRLWGVVSMLVESLGGGNELVGGVWVLLTSITALKQRMFGNTVNYTGCFVGLAGIATIYPAEVFTEIFGITQIIWFIAIGVSLIKRSPAGS
ncbi:hypothetical protein SAMN05216361_3517 [Marisediminitalea aggregata]|uniref:DUF4386 domain-containing protein n=1 Tax=Marisediminitalea aggregata TaxID=634436 RepID=A0A1M5PMD2_9ALTE|nr:hypothetical protein [Marisediminitalea aggregata]SHH02877.1 hypothetical protein SAMN05216361_3517 [Marisediminitalea aggregata]